MAKTVKRVGMWAKQWVNPSSRLEESEQTQERFLGQALTSQKNSEHQIKCPSCPLTFWAFSENTDVVIKEEGGMSTIAQKRESLLKPIRIKTEHTRPSYHGENYNICF